MSKKNIIVDDKKINETQIVINVKTLVIILSFVVGSIGTLYGLLRSDISNAKKEAAEDIVQVTNSINAVQKSVDDLEVIKVEPLDEKYHNLDKQVYFLINRTTSKEVNTNNSIVPESVMPQIE